MALKAVLQSLDDLDEALHEQYEEQDDGTYVLQIEGIRKHPETSKLQSALAKKTKELQAVKRSTKRFSALADLDEDIDLNELDPEAFATWLTAGMPTDFGGSTPDPDALRKAVDQEVARHTRKFEKEKGELSTSLDRARKFVHNRLVRSDLQASLAKLGITRPAALKGATSLLMGNGFKVLESDDDDEPFQAVFMDNGMEVPAEEFLAGWIETEEALFYKDPSGKGGSGSDGKPGGTSPNGVRTVGAAGIVTGVDPSDVLKGTVKVQM